MRCSSGRSTGGTRGWRSWPHRRRVGVWPLPSSHRAGSRSPPRRAGPRCTNCRPTCTARLPVGGVGAAAAGVGRARLQSVTPGLLAGIAGALDENAEACRPSGERSPTRPSRWPWSSPTTRPLIVGAGALAGVAARVTADALQLVAGVGAVSVSLPDGAGRAGALLRGAGPAPVEDDIFRDRVEDTGPQRARLLVVGDDGTAEDTQPRRTLRCAGAAGRGRCPPGRGGAARLAEDLGVRFPVRTSRMPRRWPGSPPPRRSASSPPPISASGWASIPARRHRPRWGTDDGSGG